MNQNNTRTKIIALTIQKIQQGQLQQLSLRNLSQQLNLTTGAFYKHFKNKDDLFYVVSEKLSHRLYAEISPAVVASLPQDPVKALLILGDQLLDYFINEPQVIDFLFFNPSVRTSYPAASPTSDKFQFLKLTKTVVAAVTRTEHTTVSEHVLFIQIWSFIQGYGILLKNKIVTKDYHLLEQTLNKLLKGGSYE
ncbi:TetR/AcrR family transcriptional regulator [Liquorilactobacillus satsumensis]|uniref:HTH tetR-type domain-containing protein n=1 Tax=Liquorilactobacillus satsumensis DSM 16230 = JCM 12392 TaxID=1423801 RepID=A0A0R1UUL9_9LACO|nr:TetR/AcrR family transcriptional regulator [Liquorilactobacillus satsumensis]KRL96831.1 hypothetical protein FD50_GL002113 [Liquorilactobacillus satsumensis DSM 16230 = JCM 12392]MCP9328937.1 TetR/AcrR family transcriptional regulator [Liquorilactobacillus satsumensis]